MIWWVSVLNWVVMKLCRWVVVGGIGLFVVISSLRLWLGCLICSDRVVIVFCGCIMNIME